MSEEHVPAEPEVPIPTEVVQPAAAPAEVPAAPAAAPEAAPETNVPRETTPVEPSTETETPAAETPAEPAVKLHTEESGTLLAEAGEKPKEGESPAEAVEPKPPEQPAEPVTYEFTLPEGVELGVEPMEQFKEFAREANIAPEHAQRLVDMHVAGMQAYQAQMLQQQQDAFLEYRRESKAAMMADPELGGSGFMTNVAAAVRMLNLMASTPEERQELNQDLLNSGMTDRLSLFRGLNRLAKIFDEPQGAAPNPQPPPDLGRQNGAGRGRINYQHPRGNGRAPS